MIGAHWMYVCKNRKVQLMFGHTLAMIVIYWQWFMVNWYRSIANSILSQILEVFIRGGGIAPLRWIRNLPLFRTLTFMVLSAYILDTVQNVPVNSSEYIPWLIKPVKRRQSTAESVIGTKKSFFDWFLPVNKHVCLHSSSCSAYTFGALKTYSAIAFGLEFFKGVISDPKAFVRNPLQRLNWNFLTFTITYPVLYRVIRWHDSCDSY